MKLNEAKTTEISKGDVEKVAKGIGVKLKVGSIDKVLESYDDYLDYKSIFSSSEIIVMIIHDQNLNEGRKIKLKLDERVKLTKANNMKKDEKTIGYWVIGIFCLAITMGYFTTEKRGSNLGTESRQTSTFVTKPGYMAAFQEVDLRNYVRYSNQGDIQAMNNITNNNNVFHLPPYEEVYVVQQKLGRVKVRLRGSNREVWTFTEALKAN